MAEDQDLRQFVENYLQGQPIQKPTGKTFTMRFGRVTSLAPYESCRLELEETFDACVPRDVAFTKLSNQVETLVASRKKIKAPMPVR